MINLKIILPNEFEKEFFEDRFSESFDRVIIDLQDRLDKEETVLAGNYEIETIKMVKESLQNAIIE